MYCRLAWAETQKARGDLAVEVGQLCKRDLFVSLGLQPHRELYPTTPSSSNPSEPKEARLVRPSGEVEHPTGRSV